MMQRFNLNYALIVFGAIFIALSFKIFFIGFLGDDITHTTADSWREAFDYGRRDRLLYFVPLGLPRFLFGNSGFYSSALWGLYGNMVIAFCGIAIFYFFLSVNLRIGPLRSATNGQVILVSALGAILFVLMPWSITPVIWHTALSQIVMIGIQIGAAAVLFSSTKFSLRIVVFVFGTILACLTYELAWGMWIPIMLIWVALGLYQSRRELIIALFAVISAQVFLIFNYITARGYEIKIQGTSIDGHSYKLNLLFENIFLRMPFEILSSLGVLSVIFLLALGLCGKIFCETLWAERSFRRDFRALMIVTACIVGVIINVLVVSIGGVQIAGTTDDARFLTASSVWLALLGQLIFLWCSGDARRASMKAAAYLIFIAILGGFYLRSWSWVEGHLSQERFVEQLPARDIREAYESAVKAIAVGEGKKPFIVVDFDTPGGVFHGWSIPHAGQFLEREIFQKTGIEFIVVSSERRVWRTVVANGEARITNCLDESALMWQNKNTAGAGLYWSVRSNNVIFFDSKIDIGCERAVHRWEVLYEFLFPFMSNPRRV